MTVQTATSDVLYNGDGVSVTFPIPFYFQLNSQIHAYVNGAIVAPASISGAGNPDGGSLTFLSAPPVGVGNVYIERQTDFLQESSYLEGGKFPAKSIEDNLDKLTMQDQELKGLSDRSIKFPPGEIAPDLPSPAERANKIYAFDDDGNPIFLSPNVAGGGIAQFITITDAGRYYASNNVEGALQEVGANEVKQVASAAALRVLTPANWNYVFILGTDGGLFYRDASDTTSAEDGGDYCGTIIRGVDYAENGVWRRVLDRYIRPEMFGAKGDGVTDDTTAINAAVEAAYATGLPVSFRAVTYIVTHMYLRKGVIYEGSGRVQGYRPAIGSVIKLKNGTNPGDVGFVRKLNAYDDGFILRNLVIDGNRDNNTSGHGLEISQWDGGAVPGGSPNGVGVTDCDAIVDGCYITQCAGNGIHTLADPDYKNPAAPITAQDANIRNLTVKNTFVKQCNGYGLYAEHITDSFFDRVQIANCDLGALNWIWSGSNIITNTKGYYNGGSATVGRDSYSFRFYNCNNTRLSLEAQEEYTSGVLLESCWLMSGEINTDSCGYPAYSAGWEDHYRYGLGYINSNACNLIHKATSFHSDYPMGCPLRIRADGGGSTGGNYGFAIELDYRNTVDAPLIELLAGSFWGSLRIDNRTTLYTSSPLRELQQIRQVIDPVNNRQWSMNGFISSSTSAEMLDIDQGDTSTAEKAIRLFRSTTSSFAHLDVMRGDGTTTVDHQLQALSGGTAYGNARFCINGGGWNNGHVTIGAYHLWIDSSGSLRIKNSTPSSDTDGTVVGTQT